MKQVDEQTTTRKSLNHRMGAASVEAVVLLPFFILIFACVLYVERLWENKQIALLEARRNAWNASEKGCAGESTESGATNELSEQMNGRGVLDDLMEIPIIGDVITGFFGTPIRVGASREVERPPVLGGGSVAVPGRYYLMCNEKNRTMGDVVIGAFRKISSGIAKAF